MSDFYNKYPYTDFHELNLDWVIERVKKLTEDWAATLEEWNSTEEQWQQLYDYVHDYFDNLDVQQEINNKINAMIADGTFVTITTPVIEAKVASMMPATVASQIGATVASQIGATVASQIGDTVASQIDAAVVTPVDTWLSQHITQPTTPVVDTSLTISGAAADAEVTGEKIGDLQARCNLLEIDLDYGDITEQMYPTMSAGTSNLNVNWWCNDKVYDMNYVKTISLYANTSTSADILIVAVSDHKVLFTGSGSGTGLINITVDMYVNEPFYVVVKGSGLGYLGCSYNIPAYGYTYDFPYSYYTESGSNSYSTGDTFNPSFTVIPDGGLTYIISIAVTSSTAQEEIKNNRMMLIDTVRTDYTDGYMNDTSTLLNPNFWISDKVFDPGYVDHVKVVNNGTATASASLIIIRNSDKTVVSIVSGSGSPGEVSIDVKHYINDQFIIGIIGENFGFARTYSDNDHHYFTASSSIITVTGVPLTITWSGAGNQYIPNMAVVYDTGFGEIGNIASNSNANYTLRSNLVHNTMRVFGDSITAGHPYETNDPIHWWRMVSRTLGYDVSSDAFTGAGFVYVSGGYNGPVFADNTDYSKYDVAICALGTNDYGNDIAIGTDTDMYDPDDPDNTVYGAINYVITHIMASNPNILLIFSLPIDRRRVGADTNLDSCWEHPNGIGKTLNDYCDAIINRCNYYGLPYIDHHNSIINRCTMPTLLGDQLHPTVEGYKALGQEMAAKVGSIIRPYVLD